MSNCQCLTVSDLAHRTLKGINWGWDKVGAFQILLGHAIGQGLLIENPLIIEINRKGRDVHPNSTISLRM